ncbi:hypothetical protein K4L44_08705 [Halosquirtibacter laminarini]|uniref:Uncharacterized protein n=1 Tax=Halosquirtibacter laminarini TaxID=3374600 RepID=A0AC61NJJ7_9BACT|nr:hypothetical protein K4L44_08705 [Prolixibacteraceae bacterium]
MAKHDEIFVSLMGHPLIKANYNIIVKDDKNREDLNASSQGLDSFTYIEGRLNANHPDIPIINAVKLLVRSVEINKRGVDDAVSNLLRELNS